MTCPVHCLCFQQHLSVSLNSPERKVSGSHRVAAAASHLRSLLCHHLPPHPPPSPAELFLFPSSNSRSQHSTPPSRLGELAYPPTDSQENVSPRPLPPSCDTSFSPSPAFHGSPPSWGPLLTPACLSAAHSCQLPHFTGHLGRQRPLCHGRLWSATSEYLAIRANRNSILSSYACPAYAQEAFI